MSDEIIITNTPPVMEVTAFSNIHQRLRYLATPLRDEEEAKNTLLYIECFTRQDTTGKEASIIRFRTDMEMWCEINPVKKYGGTLLPKNVAVTLFDLYNMVECCKDELISFWIDDETNELVVTSFYNDTIDTDELEVRFPIRKSGFVASDLDTTTEPLITINLSSTVTWTTMKELSFEQKADSVHFRFTNGKLALYSDFNGIVTRLEHKELKDVDFVGAHDFVIPFTVFHLMTSTGQVTGTDIKLYNDYIIVDADGYSFRYVLTKESDIDTSVFNLPHEAVFIINSDDGMASIEKINQINAHSKCVVVKYEKVHDGMADFTSEFDGRMKTFVRIGLATLSENPIEFDGRAFKSMFTETGVDAIAVDAIDDNRLFIGYENAYLFKAVVYDHVKFVEYRRSVK